MSQLRQGDPREPIKAVLQDVARFRSTLESDLTIAAAAVDEQAHEVAADIVSADRDALARFRESAVGRLLVRR